MMTDAASTTNRNYTLYVANLPEELNEGGIRAIFDHYGEISGFFYRSGTNWAYITYKSYSEAENAMKDLNNVPPLGLKLSLAKERSIDNKNNAKSNSFSINHNNVRRDSDCTAFVEPKKFTAESNECLIKNGLVYPLEESAIHDTYDQDVADASANALWARGQVETTSDSKRHVSLGRGYTLYEIPNPHLQIEQQIERVCEKRHPGLYQHGSDALRSRIGNCANCSNIAKHKCQICHEFYCSQECQIADWPKHKVICTPLPALVTVAGATSLIPAKVEEKMPPRRSSNVSMPLRPPKQLLQQNGNIPKDESEHKNISEKKLKSPEIVKPALRSLNTQSTATVQETNKPVKKKEDNYNRNIENANRVDETISFQMPEFLSRAKYTNVKVVAAVNDREYWVQKVAEERALTDLVIKLQDEVEKSPKVVPKVVGSMYAARYDDIWYRCLVISLRPLKVLFVDYGNDATISEDDIRDCKSFKTIPYFAAKIRLPQNVSEKYKNLNEEDILSVKTQSIDKDMVINVAIESESESEKHPPIPNNTITTPPSTPKISPQTESPEKLNSLATQGYSKLSKLITSLEIGSQGMLEIYNKLGANEYGVAVLPYYMLSEFKKQTDQMQKDCAQIKMKNPENTWSGLICGKKDGEWFRGYAMSTSPPYKIAAIDKGMIIDVECAISCPATSMEIPVAGAVCKLHTSVGDVSAPTGLNGQQTHFKVTDCKGSNQDVNYEIEFALATGRVKASLHIWNPPSSTPTTGVQFANIKNNTRVYIQSYRNQGFMYVSSIDPSSIEENLEKDQTIAKCAQTAPSLHDSPSVGQIVLAPFKDGNLYRALIRTVLKDKVLVSYIDYGNSDYVNAAKLKLLPADLQRLPSSVAKVLLKDVPRDVPMTTDVDNYLSNLVEEKAILMYSMEDAVVLKDSTGQSVNARINELLTPNWIRNRGHDDKTCYMLQDLKVIPLGNAGDTVMAYVLQNLDNSQFMLSTYKEDVISYIHNSLPKMITKYCESHEHYIPREEELCLVRYESQWHRAACVGRDATPTTCNCFMVDIGILVEIDHKDIRAMTKDFMSPDALACVCSVHNLAPTDENGEYSAAVKNRLSELIKKNTSLKVKILSASDMGSYEIELPDTHEVLIQEHLVQN